LLFDGRTPALGLVAALRAEAAEAPTPGCARAEAAERRPGSAEGRWRRDARSSCDQSSEPLLARRRPERALVVVDLERGLGVGDLDPRQLRAGEDVDVGRDVCGHVQRAGADEPDVLLGVGAEDSHLAGWAAEDRLRAAVVAGHVDRLRIARKQLDAAGLEQQVDAEGAPGLD